ncbi:hypothetical protein C0674_01905 [Sporolactobacillus terrae]|uniref:Uncharacterized protein n=1 Tax=Sporolactobacillus terrae TaxID=269673 RepID=A0ABX5Q4B2_9BACL|nr:hypothetical protein C0674_01905 [Sporolactobacillus terrae]QAA24450.1 hypothetical protein C0679_01885 [Sporolactobacillus terrae]
MQRKIPHFHVFHLDNRILSVYLLQARVCEPSILRLNGTSAACINWARPSAFRFNFGCAVGLCLHGYASSLRLLACRGRTASLLRQADICGVSLARINRDAPHTPEHLPV